MKTYVARMLDGETGGEGTYRFEGEDNLMKETADWIVGKFFDHIEKTVLEQDADWEVNGAMKNKERNVVTAIGSLIHANKPPVPFMVMISEA